MDNFIDGITWQGLDYEPHFKSNPSFQSSWTTSTGRYNFDGPKSEPPTEKFAIRYVQAHRGGLELKPAFMYRQGGRAGMFGTSKPTSVYSSCHITPIPLPYPQLTRRHIRCAALLGLAGLPFGRPRCAKLHRSRVNWILPASTGLFHHWWPWECHSPLDKTPPTPPSTASLV